LIDGREMQQERGKVTIAMCWQEKRLYAEKWGKRKKYQNESPTITARANCEKITGVNRDNHRLQRQLPGKVHQKELKMRGGWQLTGPATRFNSSLQNE